MKFIIICLSLMCISCSDDVYTLYRNSPVDENERIHVATFDSNNGEKYNRENCSFTKGYFQNNTKLEINYWCEKGKFKK